MRGKQVQTRWLALATLGTLLFTSCSQPVPLEAAPDANDPDCAQVTVRLPDIVDGLEKRETNAQATGAWGDPVQVELKCGVEATGPTTLECVSVNDVDWIVDDSKAPLYRFEAYGRVPAVEVIVDSSERSGSNVIVDLSSAVRVLPQERECTSVSDTYDLPAG